MAVTLKKLTEDLIASGLISAEELQEFRAQLPPQLRHPSPDALAGELVRQGKLTNYQAERICEGRPEGLILGNNVIVDRIGAGGMGEVFKALHRRMKRVVVVKVLHAEQTKSQVARRRFQREVDVVARLSHPNIVAAFDADEQNGLYFLVMEYIDGHDLGAIITRDGPSDIEKALDYTIQAARGLAFAHSQGIIHRDIKPSNLLLDQAGVLKVLDMGLARFHSLAREGTLAEAGANDITQANQIVGTLDYMSPEQADDSASVDHRADIYGLGCTLYRLITGRVPYRGDSAVKKLMAHRAAPIPSMQAARPETPERLDQIYQRMVRKSPDDRYGSMDEVILDLQACLDKWQAPRGPAPAQQPDPLPHPGDGAKLHDEATEAFQATEDTDTTAGKAGARSRKRRTEPAVGIDLGTTYSAVAYLDESGRPQTLNNAEGDKTTPSVVLFDGDDVVIGKEAVKAMATDMEYVAECTKRDLGRRVLRKEFSGCAYPPEALQGWILNKLRKDASKTIGSFAKAVITVPAYFDEVRRKATQDAGYLAGLDVLDIINEPTAAALAYGYQRGHLHPESNCGEPKKILVYDLGGGTFDVTVMEIGGVNFTTLATDGDVRLGGRDWDQRLVDHVAQECLRTHGLDPREDPNTFGRLLRECEDAKRTLSARSRAHIVCEYGGHAARVAVTRQQFEEMTQDLLDRTTFTTEQTIRAAGLEWSHLDRVLLVGGATRMPAVVQMLKSRFGRDPDCSVSPDEAVAHGAAIRAAWLLDKAAGIPPRFKIKNVSSHSLGIAAVNPKSKRKQTAVVIPRNTPLPTLAKRLFHTSKDDQRSVLVQIVEGESDSPDDCIQIGRCAAHDLPPNLSARTPVEVRFEYGENGRLTVRVRVVGTSTDLQHEITRETSLSNDQLDDWRERISGLPTAKQDSSDESKSTELV